MREIRNELGAQSPMICYSGALVVDEKDHPIYSVALGKEEAKQLCDAIKEKNREISVNIYSNDLWVEDIEEFWVKQEMEITGVRAKEVSFEDFSVFEEVHKILCMGEAEDIARLEQNLKQQFPQIRIYRSKDTYLEIMSMRASKSDAVHMLEQRFEIQRKESVAFGDNFNDIDMIEYAGVGVAVGNAMEEVKEAADYVTDTNDNEGLRKVLDQCF